MKLRKGITVFQRNIENDFPKKPADFKAFFEKQLSLIPTEHMESTIINIEAPGLYEHSTEVELTIKYNRFETDEEEAARHKRIKEDRKSAEKKELKMLAELKEKYPDNV